MHKANMVMSLCRLPAKSSVELSGEAPMDVNIPYVLSVTNLPKILDAIQKAAVPDSFNLDFLKDLGFTSSSDRPIIKLLKYLGMLDGSNRPLQPYRDFVDHNKSKAVLAERMRVAFDDLFISNPQAQSKPADALKGWFKSKTGVSDSVATKPRNLAQGRCSCCTLPVKYLSQLLACPGCNAMGAVVWQDDANGGQSMLLHGSFYSEPKRSSTGDPVIVCKECDEIQKLTGVQP
jgi:hypothetical protein